MLKNSHARRLRFETLESREMLSVAQVDSWTPPVVLGDALIYVATDDEHGKELWISDGTESGTRLLKDIRSGNAGSNPAQLTACGNYIFFTADDALRGTELWRTDGTEAGTVLVRNIASGSASSDPDKLTAVGNTLFFIANDGTHGSELWKSDGTISGTVFVKDVWPGEDSGCAWLSELCAVGSTLFFSAQSAEGNYELWKSDGTSSGTTLVKEIRSGSVGSYPAEMIALGNTLYFSADNGSSGTELWKSDGTSSGTILVKDIRVGSSGSTPTNFAVLNNTLFFSATDDNNGYELWKSDGTANGTLLVKDICSGSAGSSPDNLTVFGNTIYFTAKDDVSGAELWKTDGTASGTVLVKDIRSGSASSSPGELTVLGNALYFTANDGTSGTELWKTTGTSSGTTLVKDIRNGVTGSNPFHLNKFGSKLIFAASDDNDSAQLFLSDGTASGTKRIVPHKIRPKAVIANAQNLSIQQGCSLLLSAAGSVDPIGKGLTYLWDFSGKGVFTETVKPEFWFDAVNLKSNAYHTISLKVRDTEGNESAITTTNVYIRYTAPCFSVTTPEDGIIAAETTQWSFTAGDVGNQAIMHWSIDWGDGTAKTEIPGGPRNHVTVFHDYGKSGQYAITVTTNDFAGVKTTVTFGKYDVVKASAKSAVSQAAVPEDAERTQVYVSQILFEDESASHFAREIALSSEAVNRNVDFLRYMLDLDASCDNQSDDLSFDFGVSSDAIRHEQTLTRFWRIAGKIDKEADLSENLLEDLLDPMCSIPLRECRF